MEPLFDEFKPIASTLHIAELVARLKKPEKQEKTGEKKKRGITSERQSIVKEFVDEIDKEHFKEFGEHLTQKRIRHIAILLSPIKTNHELYAFLSECKDYKRRTPGGSIGKRLYGGAKLQTYGRNKSHN